MGVGVLAVTVTEIGELIASLVITRVHDFGPIDVGVKRTTRSRHESGLTAAGNGFLIRTKSGHGGTNSAEATFILHFPTLHTLSVFSASVPGQTSPKSGEPVTRISPRGTLPETDTS